MSVIVLMAVGGVLAWYLLPQRGYNVLKDAGQEECSLLIRGVNKTVAELATRPQNTENSKNRGLARPGEEQVIEGINGETLSYFKKLQSMFKKFKTVDAHLRAVKDYLWERFPPGKAQALFSIYKRYLSCEIELAEQLQYLGAPSGIDQALERLQWIQQFREEELGADLADRLFGQDYAVRKFRFQEAQILEDKTLNGEDKEEQLENLKEELAAKGISLPPLSAYQEYQLKLMIYRNELEKMADDEKKAKIREFREECFTPQEIARLEDMDQKLAKEKQIMVLYERQKRVIETDPSLNATLRQTRIRALQDKLFGNKAAGLRRREKMEQVLEEMRKTGPRG